MQLVVIKPVNHLWYYVTYKLHTCIVNLFLLLFYWCICLAYRQRKTL